MLYLLHKTKLCSMKIMPKSVQLRTFQSWNVDDVFDIEKTEIDGVVMVTKLYRKLCRKQLREIKKHGKGVAAKEVEMYANGTSNVTKFTAKRHIESFYRVV